MDFERAFIITYLRIELSFGRLQNFEQKAFEQ